MARLVKYRPVERVRPHPSSDRLSIVDLGQLIQVVHPTCEVNLLKKGDFVAYFPPGVCIDPMQAKLLGIDHYLAKSTYRGKRTACRVKAVRIRGIASFGFIVPDCTVIPSDLDRAYGAQMPKPVARKGDRACWDHPQFRSQHWHLQVGIDIRLGVVEVDGHWEYMVGSAGLILKEYTKYHQGRNTYWEYLDDNAMGLLNHLCDGSKSVVIYGRRGIAGAESRLEISCIKVRGKELPEDLVRANCELFHFDTFSSLQPGAIR